jgi:hypothetical protein
MIMLYSAVLAGCQPKNQPVSGGIYNICDPQLGSTTPGVSDTSATLGEIFNGEIDEIYIDQLYDGWLTKGQAEADLLAILSEGGIQASSGPLWNMDFPVDLVATITYQDGTQGVAAVAGWRVCFQDQTGKPWYFQWDYRLPDDW